MSEQSKKNNSRKIGKNNSYNPLLVGISDVKAIQENNNITVNLNTPSRGTINYISKLPKKAIIGVTDMDINNMSEGEINFSIINHFYWETFEKEIRRKLTFLDEFSTWEKIINLTMEEKLVTVTYQNKYSEEMKKLHGKIQLNNSELTEIDNIAGKILEVGKYFKLKERFIIMCERIDKLYEKIVIMKPSVILADMDSSDLLYLRSPASFNYYVEEISTKPPKESLLDNGWNFREFSTKLKSRTIEDVKSDITKGNRLDPENVKKEFFRQSSNYERISQVTKEALEEILNESESMKN